MTQVIEMGELQELKEQFILLNEKLEKQKIIISTYLVHMQYLILFHLHNSYL